jgi:site-specific recombinase XerD
LLHQLRLYGQGLHPIIYLFFKPGEDKPLHQSSLQKAYYKAKKDAGILKIGGIHALRHAFATHQLMAGMPLPELQHILGHKDIRTTVRYTHCFSKLSHKDYHTLRRKPSHQGNGKCCITFRIVELKRWQLSMALQSL